MRTVLKAQLTCPLFPFLGAGTSSFPKALKAIFLSVFDLHQRHYPALG